MHRRNRHIERIMKKRAKMYPALGVLGPRQVGKSTFLMKQWAELENAVYLTFDKHETALRAKRSPEQLLLSESNNQTMHLIIDEAHKVPHIFDSIKALIDENRRVGAYTLSGSVEFSEKSGVRESLAGRMGIIRLYPMTLREIEEKDFASPWVDFKFTQNDRISPSTVEKWIERGGMPIFSCFSDQDERRISIQSWLEAICYRDLQQLKGANYDSDLAFNLLKVIARNQNTLISISKIADELGTSIHNVNKHFEALASLFLIYKIPSIESPSASPIYKIFDAGVTNALLGNTSNTTTRHDCIISLVINEIYAQYEYAGKLKPDLYYYKTRGGAEIDLVLKTNDKIIGIECTTSNDITPYKLRGMKSFLKKYENAKGYIVAPVSDAYEADKNIIVVPWTVIG